VLELVRTYTASDIQTRRVRRKESLTRYESAVLPHGDSRCLVRGSCVRGAACFSCMYTFALNQHSLCAASQMWVTPVISNSSTRGWFGILGRTHEKDCVLFMSRLKIVSGLPYNIVIESWNTHASSSSQEVLLWKDAARGLKEKRERLQSVPLTLPASYSLFFPPPLFPTPRATSRSNEGRRMDLHTSFWPLF